MDGLVGGLSGSPDQVHWCASTRSGPLPAFACQRYCSRLDPKQVAESESRPIAVKSAVLPKLVLAHTTVASSSRPTSAAPGSATAKARRSAMTSAHLIVIARGAFCQARDVGTSCSA